MTWRLSRRIILFLVDRILICLQVSFKTKQCQAANVERQAQVITTHIWHRWIKEYLPSLIKRTKWQQDVRNLNVGDLVLLVDPQPQEVSGRLVG